MPFVASSTVEVETPQVAIRRRNIATQMAIIIKGNGDFQYPAFIGITMVVKGAVEGSGDLHPFVLPREVDIFGTLLATSKGNVVE